jgi:hypothetical protein
MVFRYLSIKSAVAQQGLREQATRNSPVDSHLSSIYPHCFSSPNPFRAEPRMLTLVSGVFEYLLANPLNRTGCQYRNKVVVTEGGGSISGRIVCSAINCASKSGPTLRRSTSMVVAGVLKESVITIPVPFDIMCGFRYNTFRSQSTGSWRYN